jgi:SAM-dependent methyltransferase
MALKWLSEQLLENPVPYALWQYPFVKQKVAPFLERKLITPKTRVLDVGCGPGTNVPLFTGCDYIGIDFNQRYIDYVSRKYARRFICADAITFDYEPLGQFDLIFMNSLMHHLPTDGCRTLLSKLYDRIAPNGTLVVLDLILDDTCRIAHFLAKADRGEFPRPEHEWRALLDETIHPRLFQRYDVGIGTLPLWRFFMAEAKR